MSIEKVEKWGTEAFDVNWFCVKTQPKNEHIAARYLRRVLNLEVFLPRIRFKRNTVKGAVWFNEPLFPGYLFARFNLGMHLRVVSYATGVSCVVHFGNEYPVIPDNTIEELKSIIGPEEIHTIADDFVEGETVVIGDGPFSGIEVVILRPMPGNQRVAVLMEFLGRQTIVEVDKQDLVKPSQRYRTEVFLE